ncbi:MAG: T9SS type A sorting domain-containing protein [Mariniphaga sp.]
MILGQPRSFTVTTDKVYLDALASPFNTAKPGDTIYVLAGQRLYLLLKNFVGTPEKPIIFINKGGEVIIDTDHYYGIAIQNCRYIKLTGTGSPAYFYGFNIKRVANGGGVGVIDLTSDFEIDHVSIANCKIGGFYAKTDPDCTGKTTRDVFTQYNTVIHDNYIADVGNEGLYVGSAKYYGQNVTCNGSSVLLMPSLLDGVKIYNNIVVRSAWDAIQVSSASKNCQIYNNTVLYDSQEGTDSQKSGILIGGGSQCDCYNNYIANGKGDGIESLGLGGYKVYNNVIVNAGLNYFPSDKTKPAHAIYVSDISVDKDSFFYVMNNTIINPKSDGIHFSSTKSKYSIVSSNVIINPGNFDYYENSSTSRHGVDSYVMLENNVTSITVRNNYFSRDLSSAGFEGTEPLTSPKYFKLKYGSPLIDNGDTDTKISVLFDFLNAKRPNGVRPDIGAFEFDFSTSIDDSGKNFYRQSELVQNPVKDILQIRLNMDVADCVNLAIFNVQGVLVQQPVTSDVLAGNNMIETNLSNLSSGIYFYVVRSDKYISTGKFLFHKY